MSIEKFTVCKRAFNNIEVKPIPIINQTSISNQLQHIQKINNVKGESLNKKIQTIDSITSKEILKNDEKRSYLKNSNFLKSNKNITRYHNFCRQIY